MDEAIALVYPDGNLSPIGEAFCATVNLFADFVFLQQMPECQDRRLIRDRLGDQVDAGTPLH